MKGGQNEECQTSWTHGISGQPSEWKPVGQPIPVLVRRLKVLGQKEGDVWGDTNKLYSRLAGDTYETSWDGETWKEETNYFALCTRIMELSK